MNKKISLFTLLALSLTAPSFLIAAEDLHRKQAEELLEMINPKEIFVTAFVTAFDPMMDNMKNTGVSDEKLELVKLAALDLANTVADDPELSEGMIALYMSEFTQQEIKELIQFYKTSTGQKALAKLPELMQKGAMLGQEVTQKHEAKFQARLMEILQH